MSAVHVSIGKEGSLEVSVGDSSIVIDELRIRRNSNFRVPHRVLGKGGSSIALTDEQFAILVGEFMRFTLQQPVGVERKQVGWEFLCRRS